MKLKKIFYIILITLTYGTNLYANIQDSLYISVGNKAVTTSDILNEIKIILITNNQVYSEDKKEHLQKMAIKSAVERNIKLIEIERNNFLEFNQIDLNKELERIAKRLGHDLDTLKKICKNNNLDFSLIERQVKVQLLWNSLIYVIFKDRVSVNTEEIEEQLKIIQSKTELSEYLISELLVKAENKDKLQTQINEIENKIKNEGFEKVAMDLGITESSSKGGDLGWINEKMISRKSLSKISVTSIGNITEPLFLPEGMLIYKVRDIRKIKNDIDIEKEKKRLIDAEKNKILRLHGISYFDQLKRSTSVKFFQ